MSIQYGNSGDAVKQLQQDLNKLQYSLVEDGYFGPKTLVAVQDFQQSKGLVVDGIVGPRTQAAIQLALNPNPNVDTILYGVDLYHGDSVTSWNSVKNSKISYVFLKATEGTGFVDNKFNRRWNELKENGLIRAAYHFFRPSKDAIKQAEHFWNVVGNLEDDDMPLVLDLEVDDGMPSSTVEGKALDFLLKVEALSGKRPIIYGGPYFLKDLTLAERFKDYPLWVAHYKSSGQPMIPSPWINYTFWQYSDKAQVLGIGNPCDINKYRGSLDDLKKFIADSKV